LRFPVERRLPGLLFESRPPTLPDALPRMDVAVFVGFAASGPLHTPVVIDDVRQFANVFGDDPALGWDGERGQLVFGHLGPTVRLFFRNGGRRCWVVRVAGAARTNRFAIPGLARWRDDELVPAFATARAEGSWSDDLAVSAALAAQPLALVSLELAGDRAPTARLASPDAIAIGDLVQIAWRSPVGSAGTPVLVTAIRGIDDDVVRLAERGVWLSGDWLSGDRPALPDPGSVVLAWFPGDGDDGAPPAPLTAAAPLRWDGDALIVPIAPPPPVAGEPDLEPGRLVRLRWGAEDLWLLVEQVVFVDDGSPPHTMIELRGPWRRRLTGAPPGPGTIDGAALVAERWRIGLWARRGTAQPVRLDDLGLAPGHPTYVGALPSDRSLLASEPPLSPSDRDPGVPALERQLRPLIGDATDARDHYAALWRSVATPRFPLAIAALADAFIPLGMPVLPAAYLGTRNPPGTALARDGLAAFGPELFLDADLADLTAEALPGEADFVRWQSPTSRSLTGIHAALTIDEPTLIAVPDAVHLGWSSQGQPPSDALAPPELVAALADGQTWALSWAAIDSAVRYVVEDSTSPDFVGAEPVWSGAAIALRVIDRPAGRRWFRVRATRGASASPWSNAVGLAIPPPQFQDCPEAFSQLAGPVLAAAPPDIAGTIALAWSEVPGAARYTLEEIVGGDDVARVIYQGRERSVTLRGRPPGAYSYRVRGETGATPGAWSNLASQIVPAPGRNLVHRAGDFQPDHVLRPVHRAAMRMAAARGDLLAVLSLPAHYREAEAAAHVAWLRGSASEEQTWSYAALYHPWLVGDEGPGAAAIRPVPPDGATCGALARRAAARGAWIAPANEPLRAVIELSPSFARDAWVRFADTQVNLLRDEPHGIVAQSADTLARDPDLAPIHVRRLLILLRRLALRLGPSYVFEPSNDAFRRLVQRGFEAALDTLFVRGAFAGAQRDAAYQLVVDALPTVADLGRFVVEIKVAPSLPMSFLTVRLIQSGERGVVTEVR
jgi:hypothetical protein